MASANAGVRGVIAENRSNSIMSGSRGGSLPALEQEIAIARRTLRALWRKVAPADRIFAVDRLLRDEVLSPELQRGLQAIQDVVRDRWVTARVASTMKSVTADARVASLNHALSEQHRDDFLDGHALFDALFASAEGFLRSVPAAGGRGFKELLRARDIERSRVFPILPPVEEDA